MAASAPELKPRRRTGGVLLSVTSLPSRFGVGDLGPAARRWVEQLAAAGQTWWQMLPVGPAGPGDSPYVAYSSFAGSTLLVSPEDLVGDGLLRNEDLAGPEFPDGIADYDGARTLRLGLLRRAWENFRKSPPAALRTGLAEFSQVEAEWLDDWALYAALKDVHGGAAWAGWPDDLRLRRPEALVRTRRDLAAACDEHRFRQFLWFRQWTALRSHAAARGVKLLGDMPIFVAGDSCDVWASPEVFLLDAERRSTVVAGVPPDYFAKDGQFWGNPLYDWEALRRDGYGWWISRARHAARLFDLTRLDHFRGFESAWHIPLGAKTAKEGRWVPGPGAPFLEALRRALGGLPFLAEDLGIITPAVHVLREKFGMPGMRVLQFAFDGDPNNPFLPHNYDPNTAVYTGTHDNDTTAGWWAALSDPARHPVRVYLRTDGKDIVWELIRLAWSSVAEIAIVPLQDVLILDSSARMNTPGLAKLNWRWRVSRSHEVEARLAGLRGLAEIFNRIPAWKA
ncbi:MAG: 4-alpha-glucanotransferase [Planctomycetes bacterium]|nr:4-alpha-glucanotransferase [Planctomycetota bacterium]